MGVGGHGLVGHAAHPVAHVGVGAGQASHVSVSKPFQGEVRHNSQAKAFGANVAAVAEHPNALHGARHAGVVGHGLAHGVVGHGVAHGVVGHGLAHGVVGHGLAHGVAGHGLAHGVVGHGLAHGVVGHSVAHAAPLVHAAPAYHAPVHAVAHPVAHAVAEVYPDEISPYTYNYAVADDYSNSNFNAAETSDGAGNAEGSYSVALPDGRIQHVNYHSDPVNGYVAEVTYDGTAAYPEAVPVAHAVVHPAPVVHAPHAVAHPVAHPVAHAAPLVHGGL